MAIYPEETKDRTFASGVIEAVPADRADSALGNGVFGVSYFLIFGAHSLWWITFANFSNDAFQISDSGWYLLNAVMYLPGILVIVLGLLASRIPNYLLTLFSCVLLGTGLILSASADTLSIFAAGVGAISFGLASFYAVMNAERLLGAERLEAATALGNLKSLGPLASFSAAVGILIFLAPEIILGLHSIIQNGDGLDRFAALLSLVRMPALGEDQVRQLLHVVGLVVLAIGFIAAIFVRNQPEGKIYSHLSLRRGLVPYYALNFLAGARSGIFKAAVIRLLVDDFQLQLHGTAVLVLAGQFCGFFVYRLIGRALRKFHHHNILSAIYIIVALIFLGLWLISLPGIIADDKILPVLALLFLIDSSVFGASVVTDSHLKKAARGADCLGDVATGMSLFSIGAFLVTFVGCLIWTHFHSGAFLVGAAVAVIAIGVSRRLV